MNDKPISIILMETRKTIEDAINSTRLEPTLMLYILKDICRDVSQAANTKLMSDIETYKLSNQEETKNND